MTNKKVLIILAAAALLIEGIFMIHYIPEFSRLSGGTAMPDMTLSGGEALRTETADWSPETRGLYRQIQILDMIFPVVYGVLLFGLLKKMGGTIRKTLGLPSPINHLLGLLPFTALAAMIFDYSENILTRLILMMPDTIPAALNGPLYLFTAGKFLFLTAAAFLLIPFLILLILGKKKRAQG